MIVYSTIPLGRQAMEELHETFRNNDISEGVEDCLVNDSNGQFTTTGNPLADDAIRYICDEIYNKRFPSVGRRESCMDEFVEAVLDKDGVRILGRMNAA